MVKTARNVLIGTSGWNYDHWSGSFYPQRLPHHRWLEHYARHFRSVEINNSFYRLPAEDTLRHWRDTVASDFVFSVKASRYITHMKKLKDPQQSVANFLDRISVLGDKLGPILFQMPPRWRFNEERLIEFLRGLRGDLRYTFEFRDHSWLNERTYEALAKNDAALCIYELDGFLSPKQVTADFVYVRLHGPGAAYEGSYSDRVLSGWAGALSSWSKGGHRVYCYFDNDQAGYAAKNAQRLQSMLSG